MPAASSESQAENYTPALKRLWLNHRVARNVGCACFIKKLTFPQIEFSLCAGEQTLTHVLLLRAAVFFLSCNM